MERIEDQEGEDEGLDNWLLNSPFFLQLFLEEDYPYTQCFCSSVFRVSQETAEWRLKYIRGIVSFILRVV